MIGKIKNNLKNKKAFICIETIIISILIIGLGALTIGKFISATNEQESRYEQIVNNTNSTKERPSVNNKPVISEKTSEPKEEDFNKAGNVKVESHSVIYDVFINIVGSIIGTIVLGLITLWLKNFRNKDENKEKLKEKVI